MAFNFESETPVNPASARAKLSADFLAAIQPGQPRTSLTSLLPNADSPGLLRPEQLEQKQLYRPEIMTPRRQVLPEPETIFEPGTYNFNLTETFTSPVIPVNQSYTTLPVEEPVAEFARGGSYSAAGGEFGGFRGGSSPIVREMILAALGDVFAMGPQPIRFTPQLEKEPPSKAYKLPFPN